MALLTKEEVAKQFEDIIDICKFYDGEAEETASRIICKLDGNKIEIDKSFRKTEVYNNITRFRTVIRKPITSFSKIKDGIHISFADGRLFLGKDGRVFYNGDGLTVEFGEY